MTLSFETIALTGKRQDDKVAHSLRAMAAHLQGRGCRVLTDPSIADAFEIRGMEHEAWESPVHGPDLMVAIGGDGTMLYAARLVAEVGVPLLGINRGRLGFLADVGTEDMLETVDEILNGRYSKEKRIMLDARLETPDGEVSDIALNDVVLQKRETGRMIDFQTWIDGRLVNTHGGDGLIVAPPTGSTAYALSGGGPIMHPGIDSLVMVPICPHTLSDRPLVVGADREIEVRVLEREDTRSEVTCDGHLLGELSPSARLIVRRADCVTNLIHPMSHDYFRILRSKLHWGRNTRNAGPWEGD
jgi:NAD+ kinase